MTSTSDEDSPPPQWYSRTDAAIRLGISKDRLRYLIATGQLHTERFGRRDVIPAAELDRLIARLAGQAS